MPQWGLTEKLRAAEPWGIPAEWLGPKKVITDPIHGDVYLTKLEQAVIDSSPFQRLRRIRQLGMVHLVYPGATHTRFAHALGALRVVQNLLDIILTQRESPSARRDLFRQWEEEFDQRPLSGSGSDRLQGLTEFDFRIAEVIVFARLGTLMHDLCHVAYGHSIEDELGILARHDQNVARFNEFWDRLGDGTGDPDQYREVQEVLGGEKLREALQAVILDKELDDQDQPLPLSEERLKDLDKYPFVADLVTNTICADLLDYLPRDHAFAGLPLALGQRFMSAFYVVPEPDGDGEGHYAGRVALRIARDGRERKDISTELLKHLRYRYELQERAIVHHAKLAADAMLGKALELWHDAEWLDLARERGGAHMKALFDQEAGPLSAVGVKEALINDLDQSAAHQIEIEVQELTEERLRDLGDDGLLEYLAGTSCDDEPDPPWSPFRRAAKQLAGDLLNRRLYKRAAQAAPPLARERIHERFKSREARRELEHQAAEYAGIPDDQVVIWLPDPKMRLKIAEVLVDFDRGIAPFNEYSGLGQEIYEAHRQLWTVTVFVDPRVREGDLVPVVLARLAELMGVKWDREEPRGVERPTDWPLHLAAAGALDEEDFEKEFDALVAEAKKQKVVQRAKGQRFSTLEEQVRQIAEQLKPPSRGEPPET